MNPDRPEGTTSPPSLRKPKGTASFADDSGEPSGAPPLPPFAAKADDLEAIRKAVDDAAAVGGGLWLSYIFVLFYLAIAAGAVTHADLLLQRPVKLPFLNLELPLLAFFFLAPILFLVMHAYTLVHFVLLAQKTRQFHQELVRQIPDSREIPQAGEIRIALRRQLPANIFVQFLAGPGEIRDSGFGRLLKAIAWTTLAVGPITLLLLLQIQLLPYHHHWITQTHRVALLADLALIWWLWRKILRGRVDLRGWRSWKSWAKSVPAVLPSAFAVWFSLGIATFPGEWQEDHLPGLGIIPTEWPWAHRNSGATLKWKSLHDRLFVGELDLATGRRDSLFSNTIVLSDFDLYEALKIDDPKRMDWKTYLIDLRGRHLEGALLYNAVLTKANLTGAFLNGAELFVAHLQGASLFGAHLQGASLFGARLQGASLDGADLHGASLIEAQLQGASLVGAQLLASYLDRAQLQGARLDHAGLQSASLDGADLHGAFLDYAGLQGTSLDGAQLHGTSLDHAFVWRAQFAKASLTSISASFLAWGPEFLEHDLNFVGRIEAILAKPYRRPWVEADYVKLYKSIERLPKRRFTSSAVQARELMLERVLALDCDRTDETHASCDNSIPPPPAVRGWQQALERASIDADAYGKVLAQILGDLVCSDEPDRIFVLRGFLGGGQIEATQRSAPALIDRVTSVDCPVVADLTGNDKTALRRISKSHAVQGNAAPSALPD